ncbi:hypothetical protein WQ88_06080 [Escherichia coli]|nr:hypothetical protein WQ88_06080 [Escherichia coli]
MSVFVVQMYMVLNQARLFRLKTQIKKLAWVMNATAPEQVRENVAALNINLSDADATLMREMAEALER